MVQEVFQKDCKSQILGRMLQNSIFWKRQTTTLKLKHLWLAIQDLHKIKPVNIVAWR